MKTWDGLWAELAAKAAERPAGSRTVAELDAGVHEIGKKVVEEAAEVWTAAEWESEDRLAQEAALLFTRIDVREEIDRLNGHVAAARALFESGEAIGRQLDFLTQELNREANTLCAKANDIALSRIGLDLKAVVEQFREQVQNVE